MNQQEKQTLTQLLNKVEELKNKLGSLAEVLLEISSGLNLKELIAGEDRHKFDRLRDKFLDIQDEHTKEYNEINQEIVRMGSRMEAHDERTLEIITNIVKCIEDACKATSAVEKLIENLRRDRKDSDRDFNSRINDVERDIRADIQTNYKKLEDIEDGVDGIEEHLEDVRVGNKRVQEDLHLLSDSLREKNKAMVKFLEKVGPYILIILSAIATFLASKYGWEDDCSKDNKKSVVSAEETKK